MNPSPRLAALCLAASPLAAQELAPSDPGPLLGSLLDDELVAPDSVSVVPDPLLLAADPLEEVAETVDATGSEPQVESAAGPIGVRVEVEGGRADAESSEVRLLAPFPAKPLASPPDGWKLSQPESAPPFSKPVTLANGDTVHLTIRPHVLVPDDDGEQVFALSEPGYDPGQGYAQRDTIGAVLADSIAALDHNAQRLGEASRLLDELLTSLPAPAPTEEPEIVEP